jgi:predicted  nucleic acid-binding Zn-ribbon protein
MGKSLTQMTKAELRDEVQRLTVIIADLNHRIDELEGMAIQSSAVPMDADTSRLLSNLNKRVKELEEKLNDKNQL